ncbi:DUF3598 family protein [Chamaesiphon polymorphus]|uniref:Uncharacterized protein n=1 Tax=Chamaesiphon polymorphus CCALA 037 TaxID=2107692 RepID=A0A2T1FMN6_9CYAN|nr:DUF3598 family protein [Chamaesiphon polymorphus]PSB46218.1 hypothetical protein C7B77_24880 [Chamaesiphon polymorphus CCALA 037]
MESNWDNFLKNAGEWVGTFTQVSTAGELLGSTPSILTLEALEDNQLVKFRLRRFANGTSEQPTSDTVQEYRSLGRQAVFFDTGAFSKGSLQVAPFAEFGAEYGFVSENRRSRLVQLFDKQGGFNSLTLIREIREGTDAKLRPDLTVEQLVGKWVGTACTFYADWQDPKTFATSLEVKQVGDLLEQQLTFGDRTLAEPLLWRIASAAKIDGNTLHFESGTAARKILLLPDGVSSNTPLQVSHRQPFFVEAGWLVSDDERQRLIRNYNDKGEWISSTHVVEYRVS